MNNNIDPNILSAYDYESQFMQSQQKGNRRVKMERGKMWVIRFLPAKLGPQKTWFARVARHWLSMKPIVCPRYTSPDFGGDPDAYCPCCEVAGLINESPDPEVSKFGYSAQGNPQWLTFCIAFEKDGAEQSMREILQPYEFNHYKSTFEELMAFYKAGLRRSPESIFDYKLGNDFVVTKTGKGLKLDKQDSAPIFDSKDPNYKSYIEKIEAGIKMPKLQMPTDAQLDAFSLKIQEYADKMADGGAPAEGGRGRRRPAAHSDADVDDTGGGSDGGYQENDEPAPARPRAAAAAAPARRQAPAPAPEEPQPDDSNPELAPVAPAATRRAAPAAQPTAARRPAPVEAPVPTESEAPAPAAARRPAAPSTALTPSPNRQRAAAAEAATGQPEEPGEEEDLPPEETDPAPAGEAPLNEADEQPEPPAVARKGGAGLGANIRNKIDGLSRRGA